jgi:Family of unknown function (DUF6345)
MKPFIKFAVLLLLCPLIANAQMRFSTGGVRDYIPNGCSGPDLPATISEVNNFQAWYNLGGFQSFSQWQNTNVWGSDFRDGANSDMEAGGGSDMADVYLFAGHGSCQNPPNANSPDFVLACSPNGQPNTTTIGTASRWGNSGGRLKFAFIDASCPMDLVSIANQWFPVFQGLHLAVLSTVTSVVVSLLRVPQASQLFSGRSKVWGTLGWPLALKIFNLAVAQWQLRPEKLRQTQSIVGKMSGSKAAGVTRLQTGLPGNGRA